MRNVWLLTVAQGLAACGMVVLIAFGSIVGTRIAPTPDLATLPVALIIVGVAVMTIPAALLMQHFGRKPVFIGAALGGAGGAVLAAWATAHADFAAFCCANVLMGASQGVAIQYRFAAAEYVAPAQVGDAVGKVMLGTLAAAILGPALGDHARNLMGWPEFTGSFALLAVLLSGGAITLVALETLPTHAAQSHAPARPLAVIIRQPAFLVAVLASVCAYSVMSFIMTATPISMHVHDGIGVSQTRQVISAHLIAMFGPSLASGWLVRTLGIRRMMMLGITFMAACVVVATLAGHEFAHYLWALVLLGAGWNLLFVAGTTLLTSTYAPSERFKAQGLNDFATFGVQALVSLAAGIAMTTLGWEGLNIAAVPMLVAMVAAVLWWRRAAATQGSAGRQRS